MECFTTIGLELTDNFYRMVTLIVADYLGFITK